MATSAPLARSCAQVQTAVTHKNYKPKTRTGGDLPFGNDWCYKTGFPVLLTGSQTRPRPHPSYGPDRYYKPTTKTERTADKPFSLCNQEPIPSPNQRLSTLCFSLIQTNTVSNTPAGSVRGNLTSTVPKCSGTLTDENSHLRSRMSVARSVATRVFPGLIFGYFQNL